MRILVTGADGQLGRACLEALPAAGHQTVGVDLADGDLTLPGVAAGLLAEHAPERVIHAAAYTAVDLAEDQRDRALAVNAGATALLAEACRRRGCALTYVSTDYVFAGDEPDGYLEDQPTAPLNWYGETKARGEAAVSALDDACSWQIVRTSWLYGATGRNFVRTVLDRLAAGGAMRVVDDQRGCPTYAADLAALLGALAACDARGIFHGTNRGACTWFAFARETARLAGLDPALISPCTTAEYPTPARRPACSVLLDTRLAALGVTAPPAWPDGLARCLARLAPTGPEGGP